MGIMTEGTGFRFYRIPPVRLLERCRPLVVTGKAERRFRPCQQIAFIRTVRNMARSAAPGLEGLMHYFFLIGPSRMALIADLVAFTRKQVGRLRRVRIMAEGALPRLERRMNARLVHPDLFFAVARVAEVVSFFFQDQFRDDPVPEVAVLAFLLLDHGMHVFHREVLALELGVAVETLFPGEFPLRQRRVAGHRENGPAQEKEKPRHERSAIYVDVTHGSPLGYLMRHLPLSGR